MSWILDMLILNVDPEIIKIEMSQHGDTICIGEQKGLEAKERGRIGDIKKVSVGWARARPWDQIEEGESNCYFRWAL